MAARRSGSLRRSRPITGLIDVLAVTAPTTGR
jgi:hypothetical protein